MISEVLAHDRTLTRLFPAATAFDNGDLLWDNAGVMARASAQVDQLTETANQRLFARKFAGVSMDQRLAGEPAAQGRVVVRDGVFDCTCPSTTWAVGDLIGASENSGGTALENQQVEKVTDPSLAIGYCVEAGTSVTKVRGRLIANSVKDRAQLLIDAIGGRQASTVAAEVGAVTLTPAEVIGGVIDGVPTGAATYTLPTAADLVAGMPGCKVGDMFEFIVTNNSGGANTITMAANASGGTGDGTLTVAQNVVRKFAVRITNVTPSSEAYTLYGIG